MKNKRQTSAMLCLAVFVFAHFANMRTCIERDSRNDVSADSATHSAKSYICNECHQVVILNRGNSTIKAHFKHKVSNADCQYSIRQKNLNFEDEDISKTTEKHENIS